MQALFLQALDPIAECRADHNSYGFRKARSCADAIEQCFKVLAGRHSAQWVLEGDIKACFDKISHEWLVANVPMDKAVLHKFLKAGYMEEGAFFRTQEGTPQGGIISPVLANLALDGLEALLREKYPQTSRKGRCAKVNFVRYADDFVITGSSKELLEDEVKPLVERFLSERGLELSLEKTVITHIKEGFDFLGQNVRKYGNKLLIKPSARNIATFLEKLKKLVRSHLNLSPAELIGTLNPKLKGWTNYHRHVVSSRTFHDIDNAVFWLVWQWAKRRHPKKSSGWIKAKYFTSFGGRNWVFFGETVSLVTGEPRLLGLRKAVDTKIRRHVKIQSGVNPYSPRWSTYLCARQRSGVKKEKPACIAIDVKCPSVLLPVLAEANSPRL